MIGQLFKERRALRAIKVAFQAMLLGKRVKFALAEPLAHRI